MSLMLLECTAWITEPAPRKSSALKNAWVNRWKKPAVRPSLAEREAGHHVGELRERRIREHALDVVLHDGKQRRAEHRDRRDDADRGEHPGTRVEEDLEQPPDQVDTGRDHRGGVDQRRHGRGARHGVGEPHVQRELGGLPDRAPEQQDGRHRHVEGGHAGRAHRVGHGADVAGGEPGGRDQREDAEHEGDVTDAGGDERLDRGVGVLLHLPPMPDQQVGAEPHDLPPDQQLDQVVGDDNGEHRRREDREDDVEPGEPLVGVHVAQRVDVHHQRDRGDDDEHDRGEPIHEDADLQMERADLEPRDRALVRAVSLHEVPQDADRHHERGPHHRDAVDGALARCALAEEERHHRRDEGQDRDHPGVLHERADGARAHGDGLRYHLRRFTSSTLMDSRLRNSRITMASPIPTSAAATAITNSAKTCPVTSFR